MLAGARRQVKGARAQVKTVFQAARRAAADQKIYRFRSSRIGTLRLFAVAATGGTYEVVVNNPF